MMMPFQENLSAWKATLWRQAAIVGALAALLGAGGCSTRSLLDRPLPTVTSIRHPAFREAMGALITPGFVGGNQVTVLNNGNEIFPAMLGAIRSAQKTINFETFVFEAGEIPDAFAQALAERARRGVKVKVILDAIGASKSRRYHDDLRAAGVELERYHSLLGPRLHRFNFRTHRKLLIVDGRVGFIGGVGIGDSWNGNGNTPEEWRDQHFRVTGPVVGQLQAAFNDNWLKTRRELLQGPDYFPPLAPTGHVTAKAFFSSPLQGRASVELMYHLAIASARESLLIENAYFLPDDDLVEALCAAARRGVKVQIIMPGEHMDQKAVQRASRKRWPRLLEAGVELFEFQPTMIHSKLLIADGLFVSVGSANFDPRSLRVNDEANLAVLDSAFARRLTGDFRRDQAQSRRVDPAEFHVVRKLTEAPLQTVQLPLEGQL